MACRGAGVMIAAFGDVHGSLFALEAVVTDIGQHAPDAWVNLGDQLFGGAGPAGAWPFQLALKTLHSVLEVRGNTDERCSEPLTDSSEKRAMLDWLHSVLPEGAGACGAGLPTRVTLADSTVLAAHGTPDSAWTYLLLDGRTRARDALVLERLGDTNRARVVVVGHSRQEQLRQIGALAVVNVGAVSRQMDGSPLSRWVLLEGDVSRRDLRCGSGGHLGPAARPSRREGGGPVPDWAGELNGPRHAHLPGSARWLSVHRQALRSLLEYIDKFESTDLKYIHGFR